MAEKNLEAVDLYFPVYNGIVFICANPYNVQHPLWLS